MAISTLGKHKILFIIIAFFGISSIFYLTNTYGISLTPDSSYYISVSRHLADGKGFTGYNDEPFVLQAPLYPIIFALVKILFGIDALSSAGFINAIIFGLIIYITALILMEFLESFQVLLLGLGIILVSFVMIKFLLFALSEPLFILLTLLFFFYLNKYLKTGNNTTLIISAIFTAFACLTRYIGISVILCGIISIAMFNYDKPKKRIINSIIFLFISAAPIFLWITRNFYVSHTLFGHRYVSSFTLLENLMFFFNTIIHWFVDVHFDNPISLLFIIIILFSIFVLVKKFQKKDKLDKNNIFRNILLLYIFIYSCMIIISSTTSAYDHIADRLLSPIFIPTVALIIYWLDKIPASFKNHYTHSITAAFSVLLIVVWFSYLLSNTVVMIKDYSKQSGWEFGNKEWKDSQTITYLKQIPISKNCKLYSNGPDIVYILANKEVQWSPGRTYYNSPTLINKSGEPIWNDKGEAYLVWFNKLERNFLYPIDTLQRYTKMSKIVQASDGEIYRLNIK